MKVTKRSHAKAVKVTPALLTISEAAERLRRKSATVRRMIHTGKLKAVLVGQNVMVSEDSVSEYLEPRPYVPQKPKPVCAGWNDTLRAKLAQAQESAAPSPATPAGASGGGAESAPNAGT